VSTRAAAVLALLVGCVAATACAAALPAPSELDAKRVTSRWPGVKTADLEHGRSLYAMRCSRCHELYDPGSYPPGHWETAVREMTTRSGLSGDEERLVVQYLVAVASRTERHSSTN
jgi:mono/diheme cytochrome c family protein